MDREKIEICRAHYMHSSAYKLGMSKSTSSTYLPTYVQ